MPLAVVLLLVAGCDATSNGTFEEEIIVEAYLRVGDRLPQVRVSRTSPTDRVYVFEENAIDDAEVRILLLDDAGNVDTVYGYVGLQQERGIYRPSAIGLVQPLRTYRLEVDVPGWDLVRATTLVPGEFELVNANADTVIYQSTGQLELDVTRSIYPNRQSLFIFATESLDPTLDNLTPFYRDITDDEDFQDLRVTASPIVNEGNYDVNTDGTLTIRLPWLAVAFYGPNRLTANALDDNLYDFYRTQSVQQGGSTLSPGEIPNIIERIEGGTGVFGSYASSSFDVYVQPPSVP